MRAFIAIEPDRRFVDEVADVSRRLRAVIDARYVPRRNYHVTLAFLGEITEARVRDAIACMDGLDVPSPIALRPDGIGKFGRPRNATLWMGLSKTPEVMGSHELLCDSFKAAGIDLDEKPFVPHITLARHARIPDVELPPLSFPQTANARSITLFRSILTKDGAVYKPLHSIACS